MLGQLNMYGMDRVETAIERLKAYEPPARQNINNVLGINATFESIGNDDIPF